MNIWFENEVFFCENGVELFREKKVISGKVIDRLYHPCKDRLLCYMYHVKIPSYLCFFTLIEIHYFVKSPKYVYHFSEIQIIMSYNNFDFNPFVFNQKVAFSLHTRPLIHNNDKKHKSGQFFIIKFRKSISIPDYLGDLIKKVFIRLRFYCVIEDSMLLSPSVMTTQAVLQYSGIFYFLCFFSKNTRG